MAGELELSERGAATGASPALSPGVEQLLREFYDAQHARATLERQRLERRGRGAGSQAKWNRQEVYLSDAQRQRAEAASREHLKQHGDWLEGPQRLSRAVLRDVLALQHFVDVDLEDLTLVEEERRSGDSFARDGRIAQQLLLDASRSTYHIGNGTWSFLAEAASKGLSLEESATELQAQQEDFTNRLAAALEGCLGGAEAPRILVQAVSSLLCQSGLANVERALASAPGFKMVVVSGGDQDLDFHLRPLSCDAWELRFLLRKFGFHTCIVYGSTAGPDQDGEPETVACSPESFMLKQCSIHISTAPGQVQADVREVRAEYRLLDDRGRPLPGFGAAAGPCAEALQRAGLLASQLCGGCAQACFGCLGFLYTALQRLCKRRFPGGARCVVDEKTLQ